MPAEAIGPAIAFGGGLASFVSPCVLPLVPSYLGFLTGMTLDELQVRRRWAVAHAVCFVTGFTLVFVILGAGATALGAALAYYRPWLARAGGVLVVLFGLYTIGAVRIGSFDRERRVHAELKPLGLFGSVLVGMAFAAGWTPCIGPVLGSILTVAGTGGRVGRGMLLLASYSAGLAVPFVAAAFAVDAFRRGVQRFGPWLPWVQRISGVVLVVVGVLLFTGAFTRLAAALTAITPPALPRYR